MLTGVQNIETLETIQLDSTHWADDLRLASLTGHSVPSASFKELERRFLLQRPRAASDGTWREAFVSEVETILFRRASLVRQWFEDNTYKFPKGNPDVSQVQAQMDRSILDMRNDFRVCCSLCRNCYHPCLKLNSHQGQHDCGTSHRCDGLCEYGDEHADFGEENRSCGLRYASSFCVNHR